ncbi:MAG: hypothetical protein MUF12_00630 [Sediminibacterium sp.]|jgi:hypothetical protein|nr:hypothetical protein [Sediminibacterium sp.]
MNKDQFADIFEAELQDIQLGAEKYFLQLIKNNGLVLTGELQDSFKTSVIKIATELYAEISVSFKFDGRFMDLKTLNYKGGKPDPQGSLVEGMKRFIEAKGGLSGFSGVPGYYGSNKIPITSVAINRLAYSMAQARINKGVIRRRGEGWYNKGRGIFVRDVRRILQDRISRFMVEAMAEQMKMDINLGE